VLEACNPLPLRSCESMLTVVTEWGQLGHGREREEEERRRSISGYSIPWRMYHLHGFDISLDLVHDVMHILSLNILKKYVALLVSTMEKVGWMLELETTLAIVTCQMPK